MAENMFTAFSISGQGMRLNRMKLNAVANNIANANTTKGPDGKPYKRDVVIVRGTERNSFDSELNSQIGVSVTSEAHVSNIQLSGGLPNNKIFDAYIAKDNTPERLIHDPSHPDADEEGFVHMPNINIVTEMVEMIEAQRGFEANAAVIEAAKNAVRDAMEI
jgi:flagellar basal-body rod protein FlgC